MAKKTVSSWAQIGVIPTLWETFTLIAHDYKAYIVSSVATITSIALYSMSLFRDRKSLLALFSVMSLFYVFVYMLLQMQDYALVIDTIMLFTTLSIIMYISRNIDWYNLKKES